MNFPGVFLSDEKMHAEMAAARQAGKVIGGHYASPDLGCHFMAMSLAVQKTTMKAPAWKMPWPGSRQGMKAMLRFGSAWHDVAAGFGRLPKLGLDSRHFILCTDDSHSRLWSAKVT